MSVTRHVIERLISNIDRSITHRCPFTNSISTATIFHVQRLGRIFRNSIPSPYTLPIGSRLFRPVIPVAGRVAARYKYRLCSFGSPCTLELRLLLGVWFGWRISSNSFSLPDLRSRFQQVCEFCSPLVHCHFSFSASLSMIVVLHFFFFAPGFWMNFWGFFSFLI